MTTPRRRLVIVVRADPVICGHSGEARNLAEAALDRGFDDVRIVTWTIERLQDTGLPLKPLDGVLPTAPASPSSGPNPSATTRCPTGAGSRGSPAASSSCSPTVYQRSPCRCTCRRTRSRSPTPCVSPAAPACRRRGVRGRGRRLRRHQRRARLRRERPVRRGRHVLSSYLEHDICLAVSDYTRQLIISEAAAIDAKHGTTFAAPVPRARHRLLPRRGRRLLPEPAALGRAVLARPDPDGYVLFLSRLAHAKGVDDLIAGFATSARRCSQARDRRERPDAARLRSLAAASSAADRITFLDDVDDAEKAHLMAGSAAYVLPSKPRPEFVETFGIALVEKMLAGGGPVITTDTGGIGEAVGDSRAHRPRRVPVVDRRGPGPRAVHVRRRARLLGGPRPRARPPVRPRRRARRDPRPRRPGPGRLGADSRRVTGSPRPETKADRGGLSEPPGRTLRP